MLWHTILVNFSHFFCHPKVGDKNFINVFSSSWMTFITGKLAQDVFFLFFQLPSSSSSWKKKKKTAGICYTIHGLCNMRKLPWGLCLFHLYISLSLSPLLIYDAIVSKLGQYRAENNRKLYYFFMVYLKRKGTNYGCAIPCRKTNHSDTIYIIFITNSHCIECITLLTSW